MVRSVQIYAGGIVIAGAILLGMAALQWHNQSSERFLACLVLALLGATFKVKIPGSNSSISPSFVPVFLALGTMSWAETVVMAALAGLVQSMWRTVRRPPMLQILFNAATLGLSSGAAYVLAHALAPSSPVAMCVVAATVFQLINVVIVSGVLSLTSAGTLRSIWRNCHFWSYPYHLIGAALAAVWIQSENATALGTMAVMIAVMLYLISSFYEELTRRVA